MSEINTEIRLNISEDANKCHFGVPYVCPGPHFVFTLSMHIDSSLCSLQMVSVSLVAAVPVSMIPVGV